LASSKLFGGGKKEEEKNKRKKREDEEEEERRKEEKIDSLPLTFSSSSRSPMLPNKCPRWDLQVLSKNPQNQSKMTQLVRRIEGPSEACCEEITTIDSSLSKED
jgi:hypothetical protein